MRKLANRIIWTAVFCLGWASSLLAQNRLDGRWEGEILIMGQKIGIAVAFKTEGESLRAFIDIPLQGAAGLALTKVSYAAPKVHFELPAGPSIAVFDGAAAGDSITGDFQQSGVAGKFRLVRASKAETPTPQEAVPYKQEEVSFQNGDVKLAGTLTLPPRAGPHRAVIMITGSGPQNRDEELFGFKPFKIIADHLTRNGIAVLRYDDRGVGGSTGNFAQATTEDFASDALAAVKFLKKRSDIQPHEIGLWGHSEGGIVASMVASRSGDIAFIILMSGTGVPGEKILLAQGELIARAEGASDSEVQESAAMQRRVFQAARTGKGWEELKAEGRKQALAQLEKMPPERRKAITDVDRFVNTTVEAQLKMAQTPWFKFFLDYDPAPALEKVACPVLALFGQLDLQVPARINKEAMEAALKKGGNQDYTFKLFPKANHLYQTAVSGSPSEYAGLKKEFVPQFLGIVTDWIQKRVTTGR